MNKMLKKFSSLRNGISGLSGSSTNGLRKPNFCQRYCCKLKASIWYIFALAAFMLFAYLLWKPGCYLMLVLFLQVLGLLLFLYNYRI